MVEYEGAAWVESGGFCSRKYQKQFPCKLYQLRSESVKTVEILSGSSVANVSEVMCLKSCQGLLGSLWWKLLGTCFFFQGECQSQGGHFWHQVWFRHLHSIDDSYMTMGYGSVLGLSFGECMLVQCQQFWGLGLWLAHRDGRASAWDMSECRVPVEP